MKNWSFTYRPTFCSLWNCVAIVDSSFGSVLMSVMAVDGCGQCFSLRLGWCLQATLPHYCWGPHSCEWPALPPEGMWMSVLQAASKALIWVCGLTTTGAMSLVCAFSKSQVEAHHPCSHWQERAKRLLWQWYRWLQMHSYIDCFCDNRYPHPNPHAKKCNIINRKISKSILKNVW